MNRVRALVLLVAVAVAVAAAASPASIARADGDPASDYLLTQQVFLPSQSTSASTSQRRLIGFVQAANRAGFAVRVAIISSSYDLGSVTELWRQPRMYARFLGLELSFVYARRLLVVMPNGFGFNWPSHSSVSAYRLLTRIAIPSGSAGLLSAAQTAVRRLAGAAGIKVVAPTHLATAPQTNSRDNVIIVALAVLAASLFVAFVLLRRRRIRA